MRGIILYIDALAQLRKPQSIRMMTRAGWNKNIVHDLLPVMWTYGWLHIADWEAPPGRVKATPMYKWGAGDDAPPPPTRWGKPRRAPKPMSPAATKRTTALVSLDALLHCLERQVQVKTIVAETGLDPNTVRSAVAKLVRLRLAHRSGFVIKSGMPALYTLGPGPDGNRNAMRPAADPAARRRRWRERRVPAAQAWCSMVRTLSSIAP